jgi:hypothetical protein
MTLGCSKQTLPDFAAKAIHASKSRAFHYLDEFILPQCIQQVVGIIHSWIAEDIGAPPQPLE